MNPALDDIHTRDLCVILDYFGIPHNPTRRKALCPLHEEKTPSFSWRGNFFNCFGCGKKGDSVQFIREFKDVSFPEALRSACQIYGVPYKGSRPKRNFYLEALNENYTTLKEGIQSEIDSKCLSLRLLGQVFAESTRLEKQYGNDESSPLHGFYTEGKWYTEELILNESIDNLESKLKELEHARRKLSRTA